MGPHSVGVRRRHILQTRYLGMMWVRIPVINSIYDIQRDILGCFVSHKFFVKHNVSATTALPTICVHLLTHKRTSSTCMSNPFRLAITKKKLKFQMLWFRHVITHAINLSHNCSVLLVM